MKKFLLLIVIVVILFLAVPVVNLFVGVPSNSLEKIASGNPALAKVAGVLSKKCVNCHTKEYNLPFYANLPIAKQIIQNDIEEGTRYIDLLAALRVPKDTPVSEVAIAKIEQVVEAGSMPPFRYIALHWNGGLSGSDKTDIIDWVHNVRSRYFATHGVAAAFQNEVVQPLPETVELNAEKAALGDRLYHDPRLSGDDTVSCATCHALDKGGTDQLRFSKGIAGKTGDINSPTSFNSGFQFKQFWDGRAVDLEEQADGPVNNPIEMGGNWPDVIAKLRKDEVFVKQFRAAYPEGLTGPNICDAIAEFERSLVTPNGRFDRYLKGQADAITAEEKDGYRLFKIHGCATCHVGKILGGQSFEAMGRKQDYFTPRGNVGKPDFGRFNVTKIEVDRHKFKVPTLRNIALTAPYFHDGSIVDLKKAVKVMGTCEAGVELSDGDCETLVKFLHTLTGEYRGKPLQ